jgi:hypothetical protein
MLCVDPSQLPDMSPNDRATAASFSTKSFSARSHRATGFGGRITRPPREPIPHDVVLPTSLRFGQDHLPKSPIGLGFFQPWGDTVP